METDRISKLPDHIVEKILSQLPIRDAVRTSMLASTWRYKWASIPSLIFDEQSFPQNKEANFGTKLANIIDYVLLLHLRPIQKFKLSCTSLLDHNIDRWILHLSRTPIDEFVLEHSYAGEYQVPCCLFSFQSLTHLSLSNCYVTLPLWFKRFLNLKSLSFEGVIMSKVECETLITSCPMLESLALRMPSTFDCLCLNVDAPYLQNFEIHGKISDVSLQNTPRLASIRMCELKSPKNLPKSIVNLPNLRKLEYGGNFIECFCKGDLPKEMPDVFATLQHFSTVVNFCHLDKILATLDLLEDVPNLHELHITSGYSMFYDRRDFWKFADQNCSYTKLRCMKLSKITGRQYEIDLIGHMLLCSPVLERMIVAINVDGCRDKWALVKKLLDFRRASPLAHITLLDS